MTDVQREENPDDQKFSILIKVVRHLRHFCGITRWHRELAALGDKMRLHGPS